MAVDIGKDPPAGTSAWNDAYKWLLAWLVAIIILAGINKSRIGHVFVYYWLWLLILFLVVTQYKYIVAALGPLGTSVPGGTK